MYRFRRIPTIAILTNLAVRPGDSRLLPAARFRTFGIQGRSTSMLPRVPLETGSRRVV